MKSTLIKDTTKSERIALVKQWEEEEGCENSGMNLMEYFRDYIDGRSKCCISHKLCSRNTGDRRKAYVWHGRKKILSI